MSIRISRRKFLKILVGISLATIGVGSSKILEHLLGCEKEKLKQELIAETSDKVLKTV